MRTVFFLFSLFCFSITASGQNPEGTWKITTPTPDGEQVTWTITFKSNSTYAVDLDLDGSIDVTGKYSLDGNIIKVQNDPECGCCNDLGVYKFGLENKKLWMDPVKDPCDIRRPPQKVFFSKV